ncbi:MAG TPA: HAD family phosphatase [Gemmatimonadaceae bacterium]|nr:HAD family phosphatase [Gemmatimonadaceae bacterium]
MIDAVLFEFDGVLADTARARGDALRSTLREDGINLTPDEFREHCAGRSFPEGVRAALDMKSVKLDETGIDLLVLRTERAYSAVVGKGVTLSDGVPQVIERLAGSVRLGIVTRAQRSDVDFVLSLAGLDHAFACLVTGEDVTTGKPSPAPYRVALERLSRLRVTRASSCVALEDTLVGIRSARAAGLRAVAVGALPAHVAMEADGLLQGISGLTLASLQRLVARDGERIQ